MSKKIKIKLEGTIEELEVQIANFIKDQNIKKKNMQALEAESARLEKDEREKHSLVLSLKSKQETTIDKIQKMQDLNGDRYEKVKNICSKLKIAFSEDFDQSVNTQELCITLNDVKRSVDEEDNNLNLLKAEVDAEDQNYQKKIDKLRDERTKLETNVTTHSQSIKSLNENCIKVNTEIQNSEASIPMLNQLKPKIERAQKKLNDLNDANNIDEMKEQQDILETEKIELEENLSLIEKDIDILQSASKIIGELELKQNDLLKDQKEYDRIKNKLATGFKTLFHNQTVDGNFRSKIQTKKDQLENEIKSIKDQLQTVQRETDRMQDQRVHLRKQEQNKDSEIRKIERDIDDACNGNEYVSYLASQKEKVSKHNMELAVLESSKNTYQDYIHKIDDTPCCPLCHKGFEDNEGDTLKGNIELIFKNDRIFNK